MIKSLFGGSREPGIAVIEPSATEIRVARSQSILQAALDRGFAFPHSCKVGTCTRCRCRLLEGQVKQIRDFSYALSAEELREGYILACQSRVKPGSRVRLQIDIDAAAPRHLEVMTAGTIVAQRPLTHDITELTVRVDQPLEYTAGQYAALGRPELPRPRDYSFATAPVPGGRAELSFFIRKVPGGAFTEWLFEQRRIGEALTVTGPRGDFWLRGADAPLLLVAGGSGLAPLLALLEAAVAEGVQRDAVLLFGARAQRDLYCVDAVDAIAARWRGAFRFVPILSEEPIASSWQGARGLVTDPIQPAQIPALSAHHAYLCGPPAMIDAAIEILVAVGLPLEHIHYDKFLDASSLSGT